MDNKYKLPKIDPDVLRDKFPIPKVKPPKQNEVKLSNEDVNFLKSLAHEIKTQDNFATAFPIYYTIAEPYVEWGIDNDYTYDKVEICIGEVDFENFVDIEDKDSIMISISDYFEDKSDYDDIMNDAKVQIDHGQLEEFLNDNDVEYTYIYGRETVRYHDAFLTYKEAKKHLELNSYHYNHYGKPYIYCEHNWRNNEMEKLLEIIKKIDKEE